MTPSRGRRGRPQEGRATALAPRGQTRLAKLPRLLHLGGPTPTPVYQGPAQFVGPSKRTHRKKKEPFLSTQQQCLGQQQPGPPQALLLQTFLRPSQTSSLTFTRLLHIMDFHPFECGTAYSLPSLPEGLANIGRSEHIYK